MQTRNAASTVGEVQRNCQNLHVEGHSYQRKSKDICNCELTNEQGTTHNSLEWVHTCVSLGKTEIDTQVVLGSLSEKNGSQRPKASEYFDQQ